MEAGDRDDCHPDPTYGDPIVSGGGGSLWAGVVAAAILIVVLAASAWVYLRNRNVDADLPHEEAQLSKAA